MKQSDLMRKNADNCLQLAERAEVQPMFRRYMRMADAWTALAKDTSIVILTPRSAGALDPDRADPRAPMTVVLPS